MKSKTSPYRICRRKKRGPNASRKCADGSLRAIPWQTISPPKTKPSITVAATPAGIDNKNSDLPLLYGFDSGAELLFACAEVSALHVEHAGVAL